LDTFSEESGTFTGNLVVFVHRVIKTGIATGYIDWFSAVLGFFKGSIVIIFYL